MKELLIEEKAKAYDKALVIAKSRYSIETEESVRICLELMFPELKESEDEKIRKGLIQYFSTFSLDTFAGLVPKKIIAWLKKQGEQKSTDKVKPKFKVGDKVNRNDREDEEYYILTIAYVDIDEHYYICDQDSVIDFEEQDLWHIVEQKPAEWSEEDETALGDALWCCEQAVSIAKDENDMGNAWYAEKWLKSLKGRIQSQHRWKQENTDDLTDFENAMMHIGGSFFGENAGLDPNDTNAIKEQANILLELVPKQEWSEEDEDKLNKIIDLVSNYINDEDPGDMTYEEHKNFYVKHIDWLKSLKDRMKGEINHDRQTTY